MHDEGAPAAGPMAKSFEAAACTPSTSVDALWRGRVHLEQPLRAHGYRFNLDSVLLAGFVQTDGEAMAIDLGAGCGIIGILLLLGGKATRLLAVERQRSMAALCAANAARNGLHERLQVASGDLRTLALPPASLVVFNPPYAAAAASRPSACIGRDEARRECHGTLADFVAAAATALLPGGRLAAIVPYARRHELSALCVAHGLCVRRQRAVCAYAPGPPRHILLEAAQAPPEATEALPPLIVHRAGGAFTDEVQALTEGPTRLLAVARGE